MKYVYPFNKLATIRLKVSVGLWPILVREIAIPYPLSACRTLRDEVILFIMEF